MVDPRCSSPAGARPNQVVFNTKTPRESDLVRTKAQVWPPEAVPKYAPWDREDTPSVLPDVYHFGLVRHDGRIFPYGIDSREDKLDRAVSEGSKKSESS